MSGHGEFVPDLYNAWKDIIKIEDLQTDTCDHFDIPGGSIYRDMHNNFFNLYGSMYYKNPLFLNRIAYTGQYIFEEKILEIINNLHLNLINLLAVFGILFTTIKYIQCNNYTFLKKVGEPFTARK